jgi:hypothetical protein
MRTIRPVFLLIVLAVAFLACGGSAAQLAPVGEEARAGGGLVDVDGQASVPGASAAPEAPSGEQGYDNQVGARDDAKIIRMGTIELEVSDVPKALRTARDAIVALGGYVGASSTSNDDERPTAQITYRIPAARWEDALDELRSLNDLTTKVVTEQTEAVEVTGQVIDLEARIRNLRASETALQGIAAKATKIADVLEVERRLTEVRGQIEQLTAQLDELNDRAGFATLTAYFSMPVVAVQVASQDWEPAAIVDEAAASLISVLQGLATAGIWFLIVWLPILLVLGVIALIVARWARRLGISRDGRGSGLLPPAAPSAGEPLASDG